MPRHPKPAKTKAKAKPFRTAPTREGGTVRELQKRLEEALKLKTEALEQQRATSEILGVISQSPTDINPVFDTILTNAVRLCGAVNGGLYRFDGERFHVGAACNFSGP